MLLSTASNEYEKQILLKYAESITRFVDDHFPHYEKLESFQLEVFNLITSFIQEVNDNERNGIKGRKVLRILLQSGKGVGKSDILVLIALWALVVFPQSSISVMTGRREQTIDVFFAKCANIIKKSNISNAFCLQKMKVSLVIKGKPDAFRKINGVVINASVDKLDTLSGIHTPFNLLLFDEGSTQTKEAFDRASGTISSGVTIMIVAGNPTSKSSLLYELSVRGDPAIWDKFIISCYDVEREDFNIKEMENQYGEQGTVQNDVYVKGIFTESEAGLFFSSSQLNELFSGDYSHIENLHVYDRRNSIIAIDPATGVGKDHTCILERTGSVVTLLEYSTDLKHSEIIHLIYGYYRNGYRRFVMDCCGAGRSIAAEFNKSDIHITPLFSQTKLGVDHAYHDIKSQLADMVKDSIMYDGLRFDAKQFHDAIKQEFSTIPFDYINTRLVVANKSTMKDSPDAFEAMCYLFVFGRRDFNYHESNSTSGSILSRNTGSNSLLL